MQLKQIQKQIGHDKEDKIFQSSYADDGRDYNQDNFGCFRATGTLGFAMKELKSNKPKAILGGLDPAMRRCVKPNLLTFSVPYPRFETMIENMDDCFLDTYIGEDSSRRLQKD